MTATVLVEGLIFILGIYFYIQTTRAKNRTGVIALWALIIFLVLIYISNLFGPPPPSEQMIGVVGLSQWLLIAWGYWIDRNREILHE